MRGAPRWLIKNQRTAQWFDVERYRGDIWLARPKGSDLVLFSSASLLEAKLLIWRLPTTVGTSNPKAWNEL